MRILFVSDTYYPHVNGVYYFVQRLANQLQDNGHQVAVVAPSENMYASYKKIDGIAVHGIPSLPVLYYPSVRFPIPFLLVSRIKHILAIFEPDIIHIQGHFLLSKSVIKANKKFNIPVIGTNHFMAENITSFLQSAKSKKRLERFMWADFSKVFNKTALVTTPTEMAAGLIRQKLQTEVIAISNGIELEKFNPAGDIKFIKEKYSIPDKPILLYVGRLDPEKHIDEVLRALAIAINFIDIHLIIIGKGVKKEALEKLATDMEILDNVTFTGFVPDNDLPYFYKLSTCFITASIAELQSIATMEAMASGLPVIAANAGALGELVHNEENGYLFNPGDISYLARRICDVFSEGNCIEKMKEKSLEYIAKHNIKRTVKAYEKIYQVYSGGKVIKLNSLRDEAVFQEEASKSFMDGMILQK